MHRAKTVDGVTAGVVFRLTRRIHRLKAQGRTGHDLTALNDHLLRDLGVMRVDIDHVVNGRRRP
ncbi:MAG: DUF1127 domain-containing protein [Parvibaculaceae bacterium]